MTGLAVENRDMDFLGPDGGSLAISFGSGCAAAWGFIQLAIIGPLKSQIADLKTECRERDDRHVARISQLETILLMHGPGEIRQQMQRALSEQHVEIDIIKGS